jgi:hypothetical protein
VGSRAWAIGLLGAVLAIPSLARADDDWRPTARLELDRGGATSCPDSQALTDAVTGRLGYDPFVGAGGDLRISVHFARTNDGVTGLVEAFDTDGAAKGEKKITSKRGDCAEVAQAVTLTIAILLDPRTGLVARPPPSKPEPDPLAPVIEKDKPPPPPPPPVETAIYVPHIRAGFFGTVGAEPGPSLAARAAFGVTHRAWSIDVEVRGDLPREAASSDKRASSGLLLGALVPCLRRGLFGACAVIAVGALRSEVSSGSPPTISTLHAAAGPRASAVLPLGTVLALVIDAEALFALTRTTVRVDGVDVWSPPVVSAGLGAALEVRFP